MLATETAARVGTAEAQRFQQQLLGRVSRTFALTIPQLPPPLARVVGNAYLWCRLADTIEDEPNLSVTAKQRLHEELIAVVDGQLDATGWAERTTPLVTAATPPAERQLLAGTALVAAVTETLTASQIAAIRTCVIKMCRGMSHFEAHSNPAGLETVAELDCYCYYVAGVVGEMLTTLFCDYSAEIAERRSEMSQLAASFGQGLQLTNILKDVWDDRGQGRCWLPREVFQRHRYDLAQLAPTHRRGAFNAGLKELIAVAHGHLRNALDYTLYLPKYEVGIRRFCLWSLGLAVLTLQRIARSADFAMGADVKVPRLAVGTTVAATKLVAHHNLPVRVLFEIAAHRLPLKPVSIGYTSNLHNMVAVGSA